LNLNYYIMCEKKSQVIFEKNKNIFVFSKKLL